MNTKLCSHCTTPMKQLVHLKTRLVVFWCPRCQRHEERYLRPAA